VRIQCQNGEYLATRATGPTHNYLALEFSESLPTSVKVEVLDTGPSLGCCASDVENEIVEAVLSTVLDLASELGSVKRLKTIRYVKNDSPNLEAYIILTTKIFRHMHNPEEGV
jgi:hypothetical protein